MKQSLLIALLIFSFNGCGETKESQAQHDAKVAQEAREQLLAELKAKEEAEEKAQKSRESNSTLLRMGISKEDGVITIDTNKTKSFFEQMALQVTDQVQTFAKELEDENHSGIQANESHLSIDLNKTEDFLDNWGKKMQNFAKEFDTLSKELDINTTQE